MKRSLCGMLGLLIVFITFAGFSRFEDIAEAPFTRVQGLIVTQNSMSNMIPYESLGWIEVSCKTPRIQYRRIFGQLCEWLSFGYFPNLSRESYFRRLLNAQLARIAKKNPEVQAVINTNYWPNLMARRFPQGLIHAKGEMIRYKRFAS